jgi:tRNA(Ile)-lysidine synthase
MAPFLPSGEPLARFARDLAAIGGGSGRLGIAVSGGPDSLALLLLAAAARPGEVEAATVDHGLRPESAYEARHVAAACAAIGCPHSILSVQVPGGGEGVQSEARRARYAALAGWIRERDIPILLTAHHADDQAETLLMRLQRGSGVSGLAGIRASRAFPAGDGHILRPLLGWRRAELAGIVAESKVEPVDDPSNRDEAYDRVRIRRRLAETPWLDPAALARSAAALADAEEAIEAIAARLLDERVSEEEGAVLLRADGIPAELLRRLVTACLRRVAPEAAPRGERIGALIGRLNAGETATLAGVRCSAVTGGRFRFEQAPPRRL